MADTVIIPKVGKIKELELQLGLDLAENLLLKLFVNDVTVDADTVVGDFTEMSTHGYAAKTLSMASWPTPTISGTQAVSSYAQQTFTFTAAGVVSVYGYYVVMASTNELMWAVDFATAKQIAYAGETISVTPQLKLGQT